MKKLNAAEDMVSEEQENNNQESTLKDKTPSRSEDRICFAHCKVAGFMIAKPPFSVYSTRIFH